MRYLYIALATAMIAPAALADDFVKVAVIDTGVDKKIMRGGYKNGICKVGHRDFTGTSVHDSHGHGTNVSGLIHKYAGDSKYCQVILKFYNERSSGENNMDRMVAAINYAINIKVDIINISGGGVHSNRAERSAIIKALDRGIKVVVAAGNEKCNLDRRDCNYYPAMYDSRIIVVGNGNKISPHESSNYGSFVDVWEDGYNVSGAYGPKLTGTSQSTAIKTGKVVKEYVQSRRLAKSKH